MGRSDQEIPETCWLCFFWSLKTKHSTTECLCLRRLLNNTVSTQIVTLLSDSVCISSLFTLLSETVIIFSCFLWGRRFFGLLMAFSHLRALLSNCWCKPNLSAVAASLFFFSGRTPYGADYGCNATQKSRIIHTLFGENKQEMQGYISFHLFWLDSSESVEDKQNILAGGWGSILPNGNFGCFYQQNVTFQALCNTHTHTLLTLDKHLKNYKTEKIISFYKLKMQNR